MSSLQICWRGRWFDHLIACDVRHRSGRHRHAQEVGFAPTLPLQTLLARYSTFVKA